jgi:hypothetical protein
VYAAAACTAHIGGKLPVAGCQPETVSGVGHLDAVSRHCLEPARWAALRTEWRLGATHAALRDAGASTTEPTTKKTTLQSSARTLGQSPPSPNFMAAPWQQLQSSWVCPAQTTHQQLHVLRASSGARWHARVAPCSVGITPGHAASRQCLCNLFLGLELC